jgi:nicotinate-nucleotide--dimethylbenzimidazole phosphoribosyltransferase
MLEQIVSLIRPLDSQAMEKCQQRLDNLTKPLGSLHSFEHVARRIAGIAENSRPMALKKSLIIMAGDHGVAAQGLSSRCGETTARLMGRICAGNAVVNVLAGHLCAKIVAVDMGIAEELPPLEPMLRKKIAYGTQDITKQPAMDRKQVICAVEAGIHVARQEIEQGAGVLGLGDVGIANTIAGASMIACYSNRQLSELLSGRAGTPQELTGRRIAAVEAALAKNIPDRNDPLDVLGKVGGFEIAGLVGIILGAAAYRAAVVLDGLATSAAALLAVKLAPQSKDYLIGSHFAAIRAHKEALHMMDVPAYLDLDMYAGEGTGAVLGMSVIDASLHMLNDMKTFGEAQVAVAQDGPGALKQNREV